MRIDDEDQTAANEPGIETKDGAPEPTESALDKVMKMASCQKFVGDLVKLIKMNCVTSETLKKRLLN